MRFVWLIRILTLVIAVGYCCESMPSDWYEWLYSYLGNGAVNFWGSPHSPILTAGVVGVYITAIASLPIAFAVPRWRAAATALSWCFLLMGLSLLTHMYNGYWNRYLSLTIQIINYARPLCFALPPLILAAILRQPFVQAEIARARAANKPSNHALEPTADRQ